MGASVPQSRGKARSHGWLFVVADGVRGSGLGDVAADTAVRLMENEFFDAPPSGSLVATLRNLIGRANTAVHDETLLPERRGKPMGTTVVACAVRGDEAVAAHVGGSRLYQIRDGQIVFLTGDPDLVREQAERITGAERSHSGTQQVFTPSLGLSSFVHVNTASLSLLAGDRLVLCTDGVYKAMYDDEIAHLAATKKNPQLIAEDIVRHAVDVDGSDNATVQVVSIESVENAGIYRGSRYHLATP